MSMYVYVCGIEVRVEGENSSVMHLYLKRQCVKGLNSKFIRDLFSFLL